MKVAILILSTNIEPGISNIKGIKETYVALANKLQKQGKLKNTYDFFFYYGDKNSNEKYSKNHEFRISKPDSLTENCYEIWTDLGENIYNTFEKSIIAFDVVDSYEYDFYVRTNISCYINIPVLDKFINYFDRNVVYCNAINTYINDEKYNNHLYPRGDFMVFSDKIMKGILNNSSKYWRCDEALKERICIPHVDDCMIGLCLIDYFGNKSYVDHLQMLTYNFIPTYEDIPTDGWNAWCISSRVKTIPPGIEYSGYSWDDNEYRRRDVYKMKLLNDSISEMPYDTVQIKETDISKILTDARPTLLVELKNASVPYIKLYIKNKREN